MPQVAVEVYRRLRRATILFVVEGNARHGLRRRHADKRCAVEKRLRDPEWQQWSNKEIARCWAVGYDLVEKLRAVLSLCVISDRYTQWGSTTYALNTASITRANRERNGRNRMSHTPRSTIVGPTATAVAAS